ncbi:MAG TPA: MerR family transcriptional regulator [Thermoanaerobaculia bacterium]|nr:MerR family transcriptional regulator [Thermoanaerobaculia bacterium]
MSPKARVQKRLYYKIGEACRALDIQPYVLRYWETEFPALSPSKSRSGQRVYSEKELEVIRRIKELLYEEGYTIAGAKKKLEGELQSGNHLGRGDETEEPAGEEEPFLEPASPRAAAVPAEIAPLEAELPVEVSPPAQPGQQGLLLDTRAAEQLQRARKGIQQALREAREILALLEARAPRD